MSRSRSRVFIVALIVGLFGAGLLFAGGNKEQAKSAGKVVVHFANFWVPLPSGATDPRQILIQKWQAEHPEVQLIQDITQHDSYLTVKFKTWAASNTLPDLFLIESGDMVSTYKAGELMDWTPILAQDSQWKDMFLPGIFNETTFGGKIYGIPTQFITNESFYYNSAILQKAGYTEFPITWDGLLQMSAKLKDMGYIPIALGDKAGWPLVSHLLEPLAQYLCGPDWVSKIGSFSSDASYTDPRFVNVLSLINQLQTKGYFNSDVVAADNTTDDVSYFYNEKAATRLSGSWGTNITANAPKDLIPLIKVAPVPRPANSDSASPYGIFTGGSGWEFGANTKLSAQQTTAVASLVKSMISPSGSAYLVENAMIPVLQMKYVTGWDPAKVSPLQQEMNNNISKAPHIYLMNQEQHGPIMSDTIYKATQAMLSGTLTPEQAAQQIEDQYKQQVQANAQN